MADARMIGREQLLARLAKIPAAVKDAAEDELKTEVDTLVEAMKRAAPVEDPDGKHPGLVRDSIEAIKNPVRPLSWTITVSARDMKGRLIGIWVEFGHGQAGPRPFFFPTYRAQKKRLKAAMFARTRKAIKGLFD